MATITTTKTGIERNILSAQERFRFQQYLLAHYTELGLNDSNFAKKASEELKIPISPQTVNYHRKEFSILPNSRDSGSKAWQLELIKRVETLEEQVSVLLKERHSR